MKKLATLMKDLPRYLFFTGKGGVGKTSLACTTAVFLSDLGKKVLIVSTDPASNLSQVFNSDISQKALLIKHTNTLWAMNIDPRKSAALYREKVISPYKEFLPLATIKEIEEKLSGACTVEIAAFNEFSRLMTDADIISKFDHIVFDTAPTGHTLRLLNLPKAWSDYLQANPGNTSCLGPMSGLKGQQKQFEETLSTLQNPESTRVFLVTRPDNSAIKDVSRTFDELKSLGITNQQLLINGLLEQDENHDRFALSIINRQKKALENMDEELKSLPQSIIKLSSTPPVGLPSLRLLFHQNQEKVVLASHTTNEYDAVKAWTFNELMNKLNMQSGIVMTMGKGGAGKTTVATMIAIHLAQTGKKVHLTTTDPAGDFDVSLTKKYPNLSISKIDPVAETAIYQKEVLLQSGQKLDKDELRLLEEDLKSPCTEEVAVFRAFSKIVNKSKNTITVIDTAPTGHTILLLDATEAYHREVLRNQKNTPSDLVELLPRLRDPNYTKILLLTLPEATPVQEAIELNQDLNRAEIYPYAWIINKSLSPLTVRNSVLRTRRTCEFEHICKVMSITQKLAVIPWQEI
ncbi:MAG: arsenical pump-driving ATPase [Caldisericia bacterium]|nr:arsenical pump-driving ATPase [Caldisericia bacterium]